MWEWQPPRCPHCDGLARPGRRRWVYPAAGFLHEARAQGAFTAELNIEATDATADVDIAIHAPVEETMKKLDAMV